MASRTRNRALGIAALLVAVAAAVVIFLLSQGGDDPKVTPLREDAAQQDTGNALADPPTRFHPPVPVPGARYWDRSDRRGDRKRGAGKRKGSARRGASRETGVKHERIFRPSRATPRAPRIPVNPTPSPNAAAPQTVTAPSKPAPAAGPSPIEAPAAQPASPVKNPPDESPLVKAPPVKTPPVKAPSVKAAVQEIEIEDGEIEDDVKRVRSDDGHVRLRIRSDELVLVEMDDSPLTWLIPAQGEAVIEFDTSSSKGAKLDLHHRKGLLVLRIDD